MGEMVDIMPGDTCYGNQSSVVLVYQEAGVVWSAYVGVLYIAIDRSCYKRNTG